MKPAIKTKCDCGHTVKSEGITSGYATTRDGEKLCFACCAVNDKETMIKEGHSRGLPLYIAVSEIMGAVIRKKKYEVTNWPGTLRFDVRVYSFGGHNMCGKRLDVWFNGPDGYEWHGTNYGGNTDIVHCKRTKVKRG